MRPVLASTGQTWVSYQDYRLLATEADAMQELLEVCALSKDSAVELVNEVSTRLKELMEIIPASLEPTQMSRNDLRRVLEGVAHLNGFLGTGALDPASDNVSSSPT